MGRPLPIGRVTGFRGRSGELTVKVASGEAARWGELDRVLLGADRDAVGKELEVEHARAYRDRLVLKLRGVDDASMAAALKGRLVLAPADQVPRLPEGTYYVERLLGIEVSDEAGDRIGTVKDVEESGGAALLVIEALDGEEILVPLAKEFVTEIRESQRRLTVRLPEGLRQLNAAGSRQ